jgi:pilus assembly protein CpaC
VGSVTIMFKEFGIRLTFKPEITGHNTIRMYVKPEVSTIDVANSLSLSGFTIPALATRRMETNIELGQGQSFVIAGLIDDRVTETLSKIPGLADIPILGVLFKSRMENRAKTELIVMVTPEITAPVNAADVKPLPQMRETLPNFLLVPSGTAPAATPGKTGKKK